MPEHKTKKYSNSNGFRTAMSPRSSYGRLLSAHARWLLNWLKCQQIFTYSGPGPIPEENEYQFTQWLQYNPDYDFTGSPELAIVTRSDAKTATTDNLYGASCYAWRHDAAASISWQNSSMGSAVDVWQSKQKSHQDLTAVNCFQTPAVKCVFNQPLNEPGNGDFGFDVHKLTYSKIMIAALGIYSLPDLDLDQIDSRLFDLEEFLTGRIIKGFDVGDRAGLGDLVYHLQNLEQVTARCLLQSGVPTYIYENRSADYYNIRTGTTYADADGRSRFLIQPRKLYEGDVTTTPFVVARGVGASGDAPGYVRFTSLETEDTAVIEITSNTQALYTAAGALDVANGKDKILIELQAPSNGGIAVKTYGIWED